MNQNDINKLTLTGRVETEPEMRFTADGEPHTTLFLICTQQTAGDVSVNERFRLIAWGEPFAAQCNDLLPGTHLLVEGQLRSSTCEDGDERTRMPYEVMVHTLIVLNGLAAIQPKGVAAQPAVPLAAPPRAVPSLAAESVAPQPPSPRPPAPPTLPRIPRGPQRTNRP